MSDVSTSIEVNNISKNFSLYQSPLMRLLGYFFSFNEKKVVFEAVKDVFFSLSKGETLGVVGRNGSGKSTLLQIICGTLTPTSGSVRVNGRIAALLELGAGFNPEFTGRENIFLNAAIYGLDKKAVLERLDRIIAFADIGEFIDQPVKNYSSGMFVRLAFAVIAHVDADILVIDEALAVGDILFAQKCIRFLEDFKKRGSILFVSHDTASIMRLCDKAIWLDRGRIMLQGDARSVSEAYLEHIYATQQDMGNEANFAKEKSSKREIEAQVEWHDARNDLLLGSSLRNDISIFRFEEGGGFGTGKASINNVYFSDSKNRRLSGLVGGSCVNLTIEFEVAEDIDSIIVGFMVKDRLGQILFGENNCLFHKDKPVNVLSGQRYCASYEFILPYLPIGDYVVTVAIASGESESDHIQHCWRHDALLFTVIESHVVHGLMGVPVRSCEIQPATKVVG